MSRITRKHIFTFILPFQLLQRCRSPANCFTLGLILNIHRKQLKNGIE
ncbi:hypothetical protein PROVRUST_07646 [Providencia rustigianii DSM 4541]|uniref:Uncharacterized protein n=1 Tax=Providencia rustigianii DSM 4541 TaxID=500637 RepID=D1P5Y3_9GAMM|nr:hypothetical protein PROVRUST_07646 [Providencia rustigianii DSM 4541]